MSTTFSAIINRKEIPSQSFWTEWRQAAVSIGPAGPNDIVLLGVNEPLIHLCYRLFFHLY